MEDKNKTENALEQFCQLLVFPLASSDSHWFGETSLSCHKLWPVHNSLWPIAHQITRLALCRQQCVLEKVKVSGWK